MLAIGAAKARASDSTASLEGSSTVAESAAAPANPHPWKTTATSYYYSMEGSTPAHGALYSFGKTTVAMQLLTLSYDLGGGFTATAMDQYYNNYVETYLPMPKVGTLLFKDRTVGWGDVLFNLSHSLFKNSSLVILGDIGVSVPSGSIDKKNPSNPEHGNYPYNMQLGSGTYDAEVGLVSMYVNNVFQAGTHLTTYQRLGETKNDYRLGNLYKGEGWLDFPVGLGFTPRVVGHYKVKQAIHGMDPTLGRNVYTEYYFHDQQNWDVSAAIRYEHKIAGRALVVAEAGKPFAEGCKNSDGVVISTNYYGTLGIGGTF